VDGRNLQWRNAPIDELNATVRFNGNELQVSNFTAFNDGDYLRGQGVECSDVFDRGAFRSIYIRDPDRHIVEIATRGPGFPAGGPPA